eukprot:CAMPEP_0203634124 /NCGR_PEP_ID=MMETSP0088-20131115/1174_1 /ASSEMBLY_ACC=CAM_ASM_001087 /TAXON_ID=426623 /ORGANISM="Chaetoceros affinis, Strain CCMP159" /LENGTH=181 /DNA_ID=CAMNT_0050487671 /DNA_START=115 /DNA_END=660 /DNA_ORIENTATION=-
MLRYIVLLLLTWESQAFMTPTKQHIPMYQMNSLKASSSSSSSSSSLSSESINSFLEEMHNSGYEFRVVVVGNGAILESTEVLGPVMKSSTSPKTGAELITFASSDSSFEFHVNLDKIKNVSFVESSRSMPNGEEKVLRICRLINSEGASACSLILTDSSSDSLEWFGQMKKKFGEELASSQ